MENSMNNRIGKLESEDGKSYDLNEGFNLVGRLSEVHKNDVGIDSDDAYFGRQHFVIDIVMPIDSDSEVYDYILSDYNSKNGTAVIFAANKLKKELNETARIYLRNGDIIIAGKTKLKLVIPSKDINNL